MSATSRELIKPLLNEIHEREIELDEAMVIRAFDYAAEAHEHQKRKSGEPYLKHPVAVAKILVELLDKRVDAAVLSAALLHDVVEDTSSGVEDIAGSFGEEVAHLVNGVTKIAGLPFESIESEQAENFRKMLLSMAQDARVILIKLADRLHNMRTLEYLSADRQTAISTETREIYAPLAHRLGIGRVKWELEDLSLKYLNPDAYKQVSSLIKEKRHEREELIEKVLTPVREALEAEGVKAEIRGRPKHFDSIYRKMKRKAQSFDSIRDLFGVRIITKDDPYRVLGILHNIYKPAPGQFKDYIATPKTNGYQSLHTTVLGPEGRFVEFQIRTSEMHRIAEFGIAAHYSYKEGSRPESELNERLGGFLAESPDEEEPGEYLDLLKTALYQDEVFVFTPRGELRRLALGATALDFAFLIHTEVGIHTVGARVNGRLVPLRHPLENGDTVEVITQPSATPSEYWLSILKTSRARQKVRHWLKEQRKEDSIALGREMLVRELKRHRKTLPPEKELIDPAQGLGFETQDMLLAGIGQGDVSATQVAQRLFPELAEKKRRFPIERLTRLARKSPGIEIDGVGNLMMSFAKCCQPIPGDKIVGIVTRGRGVSVHKTDCPNSFEEVVGAERRVELNWNVPDSHAFIVKLVVTGDDRQGMLADLANAITSTGTNIQASGMKGIDGQAEGTFLVEVKNLNHLDRVLKIIRKVKGVIDVERSGVSGDDL